MSKTGGAPPAGGTPPAGGAQSPFAGAAIIFDLDGTLIDTAPDLGAALNHALVEGGRRAVELPDLRRMVGRGGRVLLERACAAMGAPADEAELDRLLPIFLDFYAAHIAVESRPYPGLEPALQRLQEAGARLAVCTNKPQYLTLPLLRALGLAERFHAIVGADAAPARKPDPIHLATAIARAGGDVSRAVMVGDSDTDLQTARAVGVPCVLVRFGYSEEPVEGLGADRLIGAYDELDAALLELL